MEGSMDGMIRRGRWGLDGLLDFATYFVEERSVNGGLFEGKLTNLVVALKTRSDPVEHYQTNYS